MTVMEASPFTEIARTASVSTASTSGSVPVLCEGSHCPLKARCTKYLDHRSGVKGRLFTGIPFQRQGCAHFSEKIS